MTYDDVVSKFCLCDIEMYLKVRDGVVVAPAQYTGRRAEEVLRAARGVVVKTEGGRYFHYFVIRRSVYLRKTAVKPAAALAYIFSISVRQGSRLQYLSRPHTSPIT